MLIHGVCQLVLVSDTVMVILIMVTDMVTRTMDMDGVILTMDMAGAILIMDTVILTMAITTITPIIPVEEVLHTVIDIIKIQPILLPEKQIILILEETPQIVQLETAHHL